MVKMYVRGTELSLADLRSAMEALPCPPGLTGDCPLSRLARLHPFLPVIITRCFGDDEAMKYISELWSRYGEGDWEAARLLFIDDQEYRRAKRQYQEGNLW